MPFILLIEKPRNSKKTNPDRTLIVQRSNSPFPFPIREFFDFLDIIKFGNKTNQINLVLFNVILRLLGFFFFNFRSIFRNINMYFISNRPC
jgi:hypothetical protein